MKRACIATIDSARARIYLYQEQTNPGFELVEIADLENPGRRMPDRDVFSETRPALKGNSTPGGPGAASDDHRDAHVQEMDARFAKQIVDYLDTEVRRRKLGHLVLIAPPKMLGTLRAAADVLHRDGLVVEEIDKDLSMLFAPQLHDHLAGLDIIPPRQRLKKMARS